MYKSNFLQCYNCGALVINLPEEELKGLEGLNFMCESCGHQNLLIENKLIKGINTTKNSTSIYDLVCFL